MATTKKLQLLVVKLFKAYLSKTVKRSLSLKMDTFFGVINSLFYLIVGFVLISLLYERVPVSNIISRNQMLLVYLLFHTSNNIFFLLFTGILYIPELIISGEFNKYYIRPGNELKAVVFDNLNLPELPNILLNYVVIFLLGLVPVNFVNFILVIIIPICTSLIFGGLSLIMASISFVWKNTGSLVSFIFPISELGQYPVIIYPHAIRVILTILPIGFISYFPSLFLFDSQQSLFLVLSFLIAFLVFGFSIIIYNFFKKKYLSPGS